MKIRFPFTNNYIEIRKNKGGTMLNGNGRRHITYQIIIRKKVGNGHTGCYGKRLRKGTKEGDKCPNCKRIIPKFI